MSRQHRVWPRAGARQQQHGMALVMALIVMVVVSILGVVAMRSALFQNRVSLNSQASQMLFQAAESGLDAAVNVSKMPMLGPDLKLGTGDGEVLAGDRDLLFARASNVATRVCVSDAGPQVDGDVAAPCDVVDGQLYRVTVTLAPTPKDEDRGGSAMMEGYGGSGFVPSSVRVLAVAEIPGTNIRTIHAEDWKSGMELEEDLGK